MRISLFSRPLRGTVTRLISAHCKSSSGRRKIYLVLRYCLFHVPNEYDESLSRSGCPCRMTSSQNAICLRTKPGTNALPPAPASHAGACHSNRRSGPCIGSLNTSAQTGNVDEGWRIAPVSTHPRSSPESCGTEGRIGRTQAWQVKRTLVTDSCKRYMTRTLTLYMRDG